jgi:hypothetical protein
MDQGGVRSSAFACVILVFVFMLSFLFCGDMLWCSDVYAAKAHWRYKPNHFLSNKVPNQKSNASLVLFLSSCRNLPDSNKQQHAKEGNGVRT